MKAGRRGGRKKKNDSQVQLGGDGIVLEQGNTGRGSSWQWENHEVNFGHVEFGELWDISAEPSPEIRIHSICKKVPLGQR